ncbi:porphobilinogen synthase [Pelagicoccus sp. NFK12]|uniref:Delta-aminolevulinic acid dehydratase n=1 Tax=Pelagicoccus enzymogenes TaxID=2773457 RepID=A0A927F702_9BACT|nr:porphobilinogen synthase [Pelagicoccus enzymogenes]MBD5779392.1 porphobilinogen synthase [Pelagicoccus enzymogenes]
MKRFDKTEDFKLDLPRRPRRMRRTASLRAMAQETYVRVEDLIAPLIVKESGEKEPVGSMPGLYRLNIDDLVAECRELASLGVPAVAIFPNMDASLKDALGSEAGNPDTLTLRAVRALKAEVPGLSVITDVALDPYTSHGHDGVLNKDGSYVLNDETVRRLCEMAVLQAEAGVDIVAPSDMMDGRVGAIRKALDDRGFIDTAIMAYSAKFASAYYGPYREAVGSASAAGTTLLGKETYQMNPANRREAIMDALLDEDEGADFVMVKPAGAYLDIIRELRDASQVTVAAYQVSGEYAQIHAAAQLGWLDYEKTRDESLLAIKRAGADVILTYFAKEVARKLKG